MVFWTQIASTSKSLVENVPSRLISGSTARAASMACNVGTCTVILIWWILAIRQFAHGTVLHVTFPFNAKDIASQGEVGIPIRGM